MATEGQILHDSTYAGFLKELNPLRTRVENFENKVTRDWGGGILY